MYITSSEKGKLSELDQTEGGEINKSGLPADGDGEK